MRYVSSGQIQWTSRLKGVHRSISPELKLLESQTQETPPLQSTRCEAAALPYSQVQPVVRLSLAGRSHTHTCTCMPHVPAQTYGLSCVRPRPELSGS